MSTLTVEAIKAAIIQLPEQDQVSLASWLTQQTMDDWDKEMLQTFSPGGRGANLIAEVQRELAQSLATGDTQSLEDGLAQRRSPL